MTAHYPSRSRMRSLLVAGSLILFCAVAVILYAVHPPLWLSGSLIGIGIALLTLVVQHARQTIYVCTHCSYSFQISWLNDCVSPHLPERKLLTCPECRHTDWFPTIAYTVRNGSRSDDLA